MKVCNQTEKAAAALGAQARKLLAARRKADETRPLVEGDPGLRWEWLNAERFRNHKQDALGKAMHRAGVDAIEVDGVRIVKTSPSQAVPLRATAQGYVQQINEVLEDLEYVDMDEAIPLLQDIREWLTV